MVNLLRRREMVLASGTPTIIYQLPSATNTASYDTNVKLFDSPKSFTLLLEAKYANRNWTGSQGILGIDTGWTFRLGRASTGNKYWEGVFTGAGNLYTSIIGNNLTEDTDTKKCTYLRARMSNTASGTNRFAVRYNHVDYKIEGFCDSEYNLYAPTRSWFCLNNNISSNNTLLLNIGSAGSTVNQLIIYNGLLSDSEINSYLGV